MTIKHQFYLPGSPRCCFVEIKFLGVSARNMLLLKIHGDLPATLVSGVSWEISWVPQ